MILLREGGAPLLDTMVCSEYQMISGISYFNSQFNKIIFAREKYHIYFLLVTGMAISDMSEMVRLVGNCLKVLFRKV